MIQNYNELSKQNETHFNLRVFTDKETLKYMIQKFALFNDPDVDEVFEDRKMSGVISFKKKHIITLKYMQMLYLTVMIKKSKELLYILATRVQMKSQTLFERKQFLFIASVN